MKYILLCTIALIVCLGSSGWLAWRIGKIAKLKKGVVIAIALVLSVLFAGIITFGYLSRYYHADASAAAESPTVKQETVDGGYFFDGPGDDSALIFYPGAKVETIAYAPLMTSLAEQGIDCFLADMPFRMTIFDGAIGEKFLDAYSYETWIAAGHSMGGLTISSFAANHADQIDSLVLLAAYPSAPIPENIHLHSLYGTQDGCLDRAAYDQSEQYWPPCSSEHPIEGGNHSQYANYGPQAKDLEPHISREKQQAETVKIILEVTEEQRAKE